MNEQGLKALENLGAELGAAKAENEMLRGLLRECAGQIDLLIEVYVEDDVEPEDIAISEQIKADIHAALSRQAEPTDTFTAVDMATAAAQGLRDGQAAVEQAPAQDERTDFEAWAKSLGVACTKTPQGLMFASGRRVPVGGYILAETALAWAAWKARAYRAAQTAPQPEQTAPEGYVLLPKQCPSWLEDAYDECCEADQHFEPGLYLPAYDAMVAALSAQGAGDADS